MRLKVSSAKWRPCCLGLNVLMRNIVHPKKYTGPFPLLLLLLLWSGISNIIELTPSFRPHTFPVDSLAPGRCGNYFNTLRPIQNGRHFADDIFKWIFLNENVWISIKISFKFFPKASINNIPALVQVMAWRRTGDKPLFEPMMAQFNDAYMRHSASMS